MEYINSFSELQVKAVIELTQNTSRRKISELMSEQKKDRLVL